MYAISSAGVAFAVTRACSSGELEKCGCDRTVHGVSPQGKRGRRGRAWQAGPGRPPSQRPLCTPAGFQWSGCSDNIAYGVAFSQSFVDVRERSKGASSSRALMNLHNNEAGRKVVRHVPCHLTTGRGGLGGVPGTSLPRRATQKMFGLLRASGLRGGQASRCHNSVWPPTRTHEDMYTHTPFLSSRART